MALDVAAILMKQHALMADQPRVPVKDLPGIDWHIVNPLHAAGIHYTDELQALDWPTIASIVTGRKNLPNLAKALDRVAEFERFAGRFTVEVTAEDGTVLASYPASQLRQIAALAATAKYFGFDSGKDVQAALAAGKRINPFTGATETFTLHDIAAYKHQAAQAREAAAAAKAERTGAVVDQVVTDAAKDEFDVLVEQQLTRYAADYDTEQFTQLDWDNLRILVGLKVRVRLLQRSIGALNMAESASVADAAKKMADEIGSTIRESRQLEDALGVSMKARAARHNTATAADIFQDFTHQAKDFMVNKVTLFRCPVCSAKQEGIRLGLFVPHFPRHVITKQIKLKCPRCDTEFAQDLVTANQLAGYVEADDFVPADMPGDVRAALASRR